jgi:hypothetical protein
MARGGLVLGAGLAAAAAAAAAAARTTPVECDIVVAGGSLASLAAALAAANTSAPGTSVCFFEITDWPGGQATAGGTSAIDYGLTFAHAPAHLPGGFVDMVLAVAARGGNASIDFNPGLCTVSDTCFPPVWAAEWALSQLAAPGYPATLKTFLNTAVTGVARDAATGAVTSVTAVRRTPVAGTTGWDRPLSAALPDWYSPADSAWFTKEVLVAASPKAVVEATEFGDVLMTAAPELPVAQGIELGAENGTSWDDGCGQAATMCFWMYYGEDPAPTPDPTPWGDDGGIPFHFDSWTGHWSHAMTWRRSMAARRDAGDNTPMPGDLMLINSRNDMDFAVLWLPLAAARASVAAGAWAGGVNLTNLAAAEARAFGWYWFLKNSSATGPDPAAYARLSLNTTAAGTSTGLAKMPYLRESRRAAAGLGGWRLCHWPLAQLKVPTPDCAYPGGSDGGIMGYHFNDTIGISNYMFDQHTLNASVCTLPPYYQANGSHTDAALFYLPYRALTVDGAPNLLVAGKSLSQTFWANAATRLHPGEWVTGTAAGAAAALMAARGWTTADVAANVGVLQAVLKSPAVRQPLDWNY